MTRLRLPPLPRRARAAIQGAAPWLLGLAVVVASVLTWAALTRAPPLGGDPRAVFWVLNLDLLVLLALGVPIARRILRLRRSAQKGEAGASLHARLAYTFGLLVAVPVVAMTLFSAVFFHFGVQSWLSARVSAAITESRAVAQAYLDEHREVIRADTLAMALDLERAAPRLAGNPEALGQFVRTQASLRGLSEAMIFGDSGQILARAGLSLALDVDPMPTALLREADGGEVVFLASTDDDQVRALVRLGPYLESYLYVGRAVDPRVLDHVDATQAAADDYAALQANYAGLRLSVTLVYIAFGLLLLMGAVLVGLLFARRLAAPIGDLIAAADRVRTGDLAVRVEEDARIAELGRLAAAFNRMTDQIARAQEELRAANRQMDARRRFTETVLEGVSSGVLGLDGDGHITAVNAVAQRLLGAEALEGRTLAEVLPPAGALLARGGAQQREAVAWRGRHLLVRIAGTQGGGMVATFDDITDLEAAQRAAAWGDVARRVAHEIKNPLTPIQLSAERLRRRYAAQITDGAEIFTQCTDTIIQHVRDIGRMVDEFSAFARMPAPVMADAALAPLADEVLALQRPAHPGVSFDLAADARVVCRCDARQVRQALTNIVQNAAEAIAGQDKAGKGRVTVRVFARGGQAVVEVTDTGPGLPAGGDDLTQPYVTHKKGGTGLGLAIVRKIAEDHGGALEIGPGPGGTGARVALVLLIK
jgi:two-component system, NtrC family, nitrogen regulation sensor histidine kinase NtrY